MSLGDWLKSQDVPGISGIDTRLLTKKIRKEGAILGKIEFEGQPGVEFEDINKKHLVAEVSIKEPVTYGIGNPLKILAVDCGIKYNIIRCLVERGAEVKLVPHDHPLASELEHHDGLFLSNGPGDPSMCTATIDNLKEVLAMPDDKLKPVFGICLGNQLLSLAAGADCTKLPFGNRGQNQPVLNALTGECFITPQNHGYAVEDSKLPAGWKTLFTNANDGSPAHGECVRLVVSTFCIVHSSDFCVCMVIDDG